MIEFQKNGAGAIDFQKNNASLSFSEALLKGDKGEDGGYYKPSINNNLISWQPSKTDMPPVDDFALTLRAEGVSYTPSKEIQEIFPDLGESGIDTVQSGLDLALFYAFAGMSAEYIQCEIPAAAGTVTSDLQSTLDGFLFPAMMKAHEHDNKDTLDKLSDSNGKLQYNGSDVGLKGDKGDMPVKGTDYWTAADKQEIVNDVIAALPDGTEVSY